MPDHLSTELGTALNELSTVALTRRNLFTTCKRTAELAVLGVSNADMGGVALLEAGVVVTGGASSELVDEIDSFQYAAGEGPCLEAMRTTELVSVSSASTEARWPSFSRKAAGKGIESILSSALVVEGSVIGSLNLYSHAKRAFDDDDRRSITLFAEAASTLLSNASLLYSSRDQTERLKDSIQECDVIGRASGIFMERFLLTSEDADISLRRGATRDGKLLVQFAREVVESVVSDGA